MVNNSSISVCFIHKSYSVEGIIKTDSFLQALTTTQCRQLIPFEYVMRAAACRSNAVHTIYTDDLWECEFKQSYCSSNQQQ